MARFEHAGRSIRRASWLSIAIAAMTAALLLGAVGSASAQTSFSPFGPSIASDKADYAPGEHVVLSGAGWQPDETVSIYVEDDQGKTWFRNVDVTADEVGRITDEFDLPTWFVATYSVTATGLESGVATTSFTDSAAELQGQSSPACTRNPCDNGWESGNLTGWAETNVIPMRVKLTGSFSSNRFQISFDRTSPSAGGTTFGIETLKNFRGATGDVTVSGVTACDTSGDKWGYCFNVTSPASRFVLFDAVMAVGARSFNGNSMAISGVDPNGMGVVQIAKPGTAQIPPGNPDLEVIKTCTAGCSAATSPNTAPAGATVTYKLNYRNLATTAANNGTSVVLRDILDSNETFVSCSDDCSRSGGSPDTLTWNLGSVPAGASGSVTVQAQLTSTVGTQVINEGNIASPQIDSNTANNVSKLTTTTQTAAHATRTSVSCSPNPVTYGGASSCTATVTDTAASGQTAPTGTVTFDNGTASGTFGSTTCTLGSPTSSSSSCSVTYTPSAVGTGTHPIGASYAGNSTHNASNGSANLTVQKATPTVNITWADSTYNGSSNAASAKVQGVGTETNLSPEATLEYFSGLAGLPGTGTATAPTNAGTYTGRASFAGNDNYNSASATKGITIAKADQAISFVAPSGKNFLSADFDPGATASPSGLAVSYSSSTLGNCTIVDGKIHVVGAGTCTVTASQAGNDNFNAATPVERSFTIAKATTTVTLTVAPSTVQYSDKVDLTATVAPAIAGAVQFRKSTGGSTYSDIGSPVSVSNGAAALNNQQINDVPGTSVRFKAVFSPSDNANYGSSDDDKPLTVTQENAAASYTGPMFMFTPTTTSTTASVPLRATIQDPTALPSSDSRYDGSAGDIRNASVTFVARESGAGYLAGATICTATLALIDAADSKTATATCSASFSTGGGDSDSVRVGIVVGSYYAQNSATDDTVVTVSKPIASQFITGGGYLLLDSTSAGTYKGDAGSKNNFGFNVKYNSKGTNLQGRVNTIIRRGGRVYQVKANNLATLGVSYCKPGATAGTVTSCTATPVAPCTYNASSTCPIQSTFTGSASIQDVTNPTSPVSIEGGATVQLDMVDWGEPGSNGPAGPDQLGISVWTKSNTLWYSSRWSGSKTLMQLLNGGNLVVH